MNKMDNSSPNPPGFGNNNLENAGTNNNNNINSEKLSPSETSSDMDDTSMYNSNQDVPSSELMKMRKPIFRVKKACVNCAKAHACCSTYRPCRRCMQRGLVCWDTKPKKRGPKRRIKGNNSTSSSPVPENDTSMSSGDSNPSNSMSGSNEPEYNPNPNLNHHLQVNRPSSGTSQQNGSLSNGSSDSSNQNSQPMSSTMSSFSHHEMFPEQNNNWRSGTLSPNSGNPGGMPLSYQHHFSQQQQHPQPSNISTNNAMMGTNSQFSSTPSRNNITYQFNQKPNFEKGPLFPSRLHSGSGSNLSKQKPLPAISTSASRIPPQFSNTPHSQMTFNPSNTNRAYPRSVMEQPLRKVSISNLADNSSENQQQQQQQLPSLSNLQTAAMPFQKSNLSPHQQQHFDYFSSKQPNSRPENKELPNISKSLGMNAFRNFADKNNDTSMTQATNTPDNNAWTSAASEMYKDLVMRNQNEQKSNIQKTSQN